MVVGYNIKNSIDQKGIEIIDEPPPITSSDGPMDSAWPMKCHDNRHTGRSPYSTADNPGIEKWRYDTDDWICGGIVIDNNGVLYFGDYGNKLVALYSNNATLKWKYKTGGWIASTPAIGDDGTIYAASNDNRIYAMNPNGTLKWKTLTDGIISSSPAIGLDGTIYVCNYNSRIVAINPNGTIKWKYKMNGDTTCDPAIGDDGTIYIGSFDNYLYAMNPNGTLKWRFKTGDKIYGSASIADDGTIYIGSSWDSYLYALYPNGTMKWRYKKAGTPSNPSIASDGTIYSTYVHDLIALNPDGSLKWKFYVGEARYFGISAPAISDDGTIYIGVENSDYKGGWIYAISPSGNLIWRKQISKDKYVRSSPCIDSDGTVYIGTAYSMGIGYLHAFGSQKSNTEPEKPTVEGPNTGKVDKKYTFEFQSSDPENNPVSYHVFWGDGTETDWTNDVGSGESVEINKKWTEEGSFTIRAKARDTYGLETDSTYHTVKISNSRTRTSHLMQLLDMFPMLQSILNLLH